jgi:hypothetical protein
MEGGVEKLLKNEKKQTKKRYKPVRTLEWDLIRERLSPNVVIIIL